MSSLKQLIESGTKLWLDSIDLDLVKKNREIGASGATSNPIIVANLLKSGRYDARLRELKQSGMDAEAVAWAITDEIVSAAEAVFLPVWEETKGNDGYVSFELDPLVEISDLSVAARAERYVELASRWSDGRPNRMIKVPATPAGLAALEEMVARGISVNVTLVFSARQYQLARDACWRGAQRRASADRFKSVYSIFVSRLDVYTEEQVPELTSDAQGLVGIVNAKRIWRDNQEFWQGKNLPLSQEIIFASTGTKKPEDPPHKYVAAFAGSDIETNPPATNDAVEASQVEICRRIEEMPSAELLQEIDSKVDFTRLEETLMEEGLKKFADPQLALLELVRSL